MRPAHEKSTHVHTLWSQSSRHRGQAMVQRLHHLWMPCVCANSTILGMKMSDIIAEIGIAELPLPYQRLTGHKTHANVQLTSATFFRSLQKSNWLRLISFHGYGGSQDQKQPFAPFQAFHPPRSRNISSFLLHGRQYTSPSVIGLNTCKFLLNPKCPAKTAETVNPNWAACQGAYHLRCFFTTNGILGQEKCWKDDQNCYRFPLTFEASMIQSPKKKIRQTRLRCLWNTPSVKHSLVKSRPLAVLVRVDSSWSCNHQRTPAVGEHAPHKNGHHVTQCLRVCLQHA